MENDVLEMRNISKQFSGVYALKDMHLNLKKGELHAIVGENGAGKSTLIKILGGIYKPDSGKIYMNGIEQKISDVKDARAKGINIIHQEICLVPYLSVYENIFLGREITNALHLKDKRLMRQKAQKILDDLNINIPPNTLIKELTIAQQQLVEIVKAISFDVKILVMDEPTSSLAENEVQTLFEVIEKLKKDGVSIIYISHKMDEIFQIADTVTVIRDGNYVSTKPVENTTADELVRLMVGRKIENFYIRTFNPKGEVALEVSNFNSQNYFHDINFHVRKGEIVGFAGLIGAGRSEIMLSIFGAQKYDSGQIRLHSKEIQIRKPKDAIQNGIAMVPEDRKGQGLVLTNTVGFNITLAALKYLIHRKFISKKKAAHLVDKYVNDLMIKTRNHEQLAIELSGGNQQKVVFGKWLATQPEILILDEPTRGVDVGAKAEIYRIMNDYAKRGLAIIMVSSELPELINMCDRIYVMHEGQIKAELDKNDFSQDIIMKYATGGE